MERKIKVAQIGCGKMSKYTMRYVYEKGAEMVLAFDIASDLFGTDIGSIMELDDKGVKVEENSSFYIISERRKRPSLRSRWRPEYRPILKNYI